MTLIRWTQEFPSHPLLQGSVLTIGNFDGLHMGHQHIIGATVSQAAEIRLPSVALTFNPHPSVILAPHRPISLLMNLDEKLMMLDRLGIDVGWALAFTPSIAEMPPDRFMEALVSAVLPESIHVGEGFRFGHRREGTSEFMKTWGRTHGVRVITYPLLQVGREPVSSSRIRALLKEGNVIEATPLLGRPYRLSGTVIRGVGRGRHLGFPTANLQTDEQLLPLSGVYITGVSSHLWSGEQLGLTNIGTQPTFHGGSLAVETHCPQASGDWYKTPLHIDFYHRLRGEQKFNSKDELQVQIQKDIDQGVHWWNQFKS